MGCDNIGIFATEQFVRKFDPDTMCLLKEKQATEALRREAGDTEKYSEVLAATELTNEIMESFVDAVDVFADGRLEMHLKIDEDV